MEGEANTTPEVTPQPAVDTPVQDVQPDTNISAQDSGSIIGDNQTNAEESGSLLGNETTDNVEQPEVLAEPIQYEDFNMPEGIAVDKEGMESAKKAFSEYGLSQEQSQKLVDMNTQMVQQALQAKDQEWLNTTDKWAKDVSADPELGGRNYKNSIAMANRSLAKFDNTGELTDFLTTTQAGNNPAFIRFLVNIDRAVGEDSFERGGGRTPARELSDAEAFYPDQFKREQTYTNL